MIEMINVNSFYEIKNNFRLIKRESSNKKTWSVKEISFSGKDIVKMFSLKRFLVSECILIIDFFCESLWSQDQRCVSRKCIPREIFEQIGVGILYLHIF